jgi:cytochrome b561
MPLLNDRCQFGLATVLLHWITALIVIGLFILGVYMVGLDYYSPWYHRAPPIHESIGLIFFFVMLLRVVLRLFNPPPRPLTTLHNLERKLAPLVHLAFYLLIFLVLISGFLISSASGDAVAIFNWFTLPALQLGIEKQQDLAGVWHDRIAWALISLALLHTLAAFKHHVYDKDATLLRILGCKTRSQASTEINQP